MANKQLIGGRTAVLSPDATTSDASPIITWQPVDGSRSYEVFLNRTDVSAHIIRVPDIAATTFETGVLEDGDYTVWVRAISLTGTAAAWSPPSRFTVAAVQSDIAVVPEISRLITFDTTPTLTWSAHPDAASYEVHLFDGRNTMTRTITDAAAWTAANLGHSRWQWWVRPTDEHGNAGPFSAPAIIDTSARPVGLAPAGNVSGTPTLMWTPVSGADRYLLQIDGISSGENRIVREDQLTTSEFTPTTPLPAGEYRFWVRAITSAAPGDGFWSFPVTFTIT